MTISKSPTHDLSTLEGVRVFCFAVAKLAERLSNRDSDNSAELGAEAERIERLAIKLGGNTTEQKVSATLAKVTDFNFRDPQFLGYLENNKTLRDFLSDLSEKPFVNRKDSRTYEVIKKYDKLPVCQIESLSFLNDILDVVDDLIDRAEKSCLHLEVPFGCASNENMIREFFRQFGKKGGDSESEIDYRYDAAVKAVRLERMRKPHINDSKGKPKEYFQLACIVRDILEKEFVVVHPHTPSRENQIRVINADFEIAVETVTRLARKIKKDHKNFWKSLEPGTYTIKLGSSNGPILQNRPCITLVKKI